VVIVSKDSTNIVLQKLALDMFSTCLQYNVNIIMVWIPRSENDNADILSRIADNDDCSIFQYIFQMIEYIWGPYVDWFASLHNFKLKIFLF